MKDGRRARSNFWLWFTQLRFGSLLLAGCLLLFAVGWFVGSTQRPALGAKEAAPPRSRVNYHDIVGKEAAGTVHVCTNTCPKAKNGVCDDGRAVEADGVTRQLWCDLGTDCDDCGAYEGPPLPEWPEGGPVAHLVARKVPLLSARTFTQPPMQVVYTDPLQDVDVSAALENDRILETGISQIFYQVLRGKCEDKKSGDRKLVVDVGANFGYFSTYAALLGCRVVAWEPVPHFRAIAQATLALNGVAGRVSLRGRVVSDVNGEEVEMQAPTVGIWGTASVAGINQREAQKAQSFKVKSERVDSVVREDVLLMKVDVEGFESLVLRSAQATISNHDVRNIVLEYNAGVGERMPTWRPEFSHLIHANPTMLMTLLLQGYRMVQLNDNVAKGQYAFYDTGLPALPEVTLDNVRYDMQDAVAFKAGIEALVKGKAGTGLNCPTPAELRALNPGQWGDCNHMPQDAHPKSLRSSFPYNTNLWASKDHAQLKANGTVGAMGLTQDLKTDWASTVNPDYGMGQYACKYLPADQLVRNRCSCTYSALQNHTASEQEQCKREEAAALRALREGGFKFIELGSMQGGKVDKSVVARAVAALGVRGHKP